MRGRSGRTRARPASAPAVAPSPRSRAPSRGSWVAGDGIDDEVDEGLAVHPDPDLGVGGPIPAVPAARFRADRPAAVEPVGRVDAHVEPATLDELRTDQPRHCDRVVDRWAVPAVSLAVVDAEE